MRTIQFMVNRFKELEGQKGFPTQFDAFDAWLYEVNKVIENIKNTSIDYEDRRKREQELMDNILKSE